MALQGSAVDTAAATGAGPGPAPRPRPTRRSGACPRRSVGPPWPPRPALSPIPPGCSLARRARTPSWSTGGASMCSSWRCAPCASPGSSNRRGGASTAVTRAVPVVLGVACLAWTVGDILTTIQSFGGASPPVPSASDVFYFAFYPVAFVCFAMLIRRGSGGAFLATSLDGVIAGLAVAALSAALAERAAHFTHTSVMAAGTSLAYPLGDVLLFVLAIGGLTILPRGSGPSSPSSASPSSSPTSGTPSTCCSPAARSAPSPTRWRGRSPSRCSRWRPGSCRRTSRPPGPSGSPASGCPPSAP